MNKNAVQSEATQRGRHQPGERRGPNLWSQHVPTCKHLLVAYVMMLVSPKMLAPIRVTPGLHLLHVWRLSEVGAGEAVLRDRNLAGAHVLWKEIHLQTCFFLRDTVNFRPSRQSHSSGRDIRHDSIVLSPSLRWCHQAGMFGGSFQNRHIVFTFITTLKPSLGLLGGLGRTSCQ